MAKIELIMPKMGESIMEATILKWVKKPGDKVEMDETILEIATDKVDSDIPSPVDGILSEVLFEKDSVVEVGTVIAIIETESEEVVPKPTPSLKEDSPSPSTSGLKEEDRDIIQEEVPYIPQPSIQKGIPSTSGDRFYSPLVRNIAKTEGISLEELNRIEGSGAGGRVTKSDILGYIDRKESPDTDKSSSLSLTNGLSKSESKADVKEPSKFSAQDEIIEMDRMRKIIADHMVMSKRTSAHVTSFVEADVTDIVNWRNKVKDSFENKYGQKLTFTPLFIEAIVKSIREFPMINISVDGNKIIRKKDVNIGMATALPSGNLIVPVIKNADFLNLAGLTAKVNDLADRARKNQLKPEEINGGTFTLTNVGTFGNVMGTPIINQPQVAILATGAIRKKPAVIETEYGDLIAVRSMMFLSLSYDHRVVDGYLGGSFLRRIADHLENFDVKREV
ncbi:MAG TPA: dihydrolipoamide acetyltransferase family protein [Saprospiraceae bacterium]|nr:dihydrolipoamide acetyltransferase family protein [Saprospiraceae bacterium]